MIGMRSRTRNYGDLKVAKNGPTVQVSYVVQLVQAHATYMYKYVITADSAWSHPVTKASA